MESRETFVQVLEAAFPAPRTDAARALGGLFLELYDGVVETQKLCGKALQQIAEATGVRAKAPSPRQEEVADDEVIDTTPGRTQAPSSPAEAVSNEPPLVSPTSPPIPKEMREQMIAQGLNPDTGEVLPSVPPPAPPAPPKKPGAQAPNGGR